MQDDFATLYAYNRWADRRVIEACRALSEVQYAAEPVPGWSSVRSSLVHIAVVTHGWLRALTGEVVGNPPAEADLPGIDNVARVLDHADEVLKGLLTTLTPEDLNTPRTLHGGGRTATLAPWMVLRHVVNHSTYHRGQVASKLKRFGIEPPVTDFIVWVFEEMAKQS